MYMRLAHNTLSPAKTKMADSYSKIIEPHYTATAYGLQVRGLSSTLLLPVDRPEWPAVTVSTAAAEDVSPPEHMGDTAATALFVDGAYGYFDRASATATFCTRAPLEDGHLIHPFLGVAGAVFARWHGREAFHGGAFLADGRAWGVLSPRAGGKSSLLADLAVRGYGILADDIVVTESDTAFAGPRCIDLRRPVAAQLDLLGRAEAVRSRRRLRLPIEAVPEEARLTGWVFLGWGREPEPELRPLSNPAHRLRRLCRHLAVKQAPADPLVLVDLARLPAWELRRPRVWSSAPAASDLLVRLLAS
jgi:hypothetical protein